MEAGSSFVSAGESMIGVDAISFYTELEQSFGLSGEVLFVGGAPSVSDLHGVSMRRVTFEVPLLKINSYHLNETLRSSIFGCRRSEPGV